MGPAQRDTLARWQPGPGAATGGIQVVRVSSLSCHIYDSFQPQRPRSWAVAKLPRETQSSRARCDQRRGAAESEALSLTVVEIHRDPPSSARAATLVKPRSVANRAGPSGDDRRYAPRWVTPPFEFERLAQGQRRGSPRRQTKASGECCRALAIDHPCHTLDGLAIGQL